MTISNSFLTVSQFKPAFIKTNFPVSLFIDNSFMIMPKDILGKLLTELILMEYWNINDLCCFAVNK